MESRRAEGVVTGAGVPAAEDEFRHVGPDASPSAGEDASTRGSRGGRQVDEDGVQKLVGEAADEVLRAAAADCGLLHGRGSR
jgi:hypothetical protein